VSTGKAFADAFPFFVARVKVLKSYFKRKL